MPRRERGQTSAQRKAKSKWDKWCRPCRSFHKPWFFLTCPLDPLYPNTKNEKCIPVRLNARMLDELKKLEPEKKHSFTNESQLLIVRKVSDEVHQWLKDLREMRSTYLEANQIDMIWKAIWKLIPINGEVVERFNTLGDWEDFKRKLEEVSEEMKQRDELVSMSRSAEQILEERTSAAGASTSLEGEWSQELTILPKAT